MPQHSSESHTSPTSTKLAFFDLDGTLIDGYDYIYQHLWGYFGVEKAQTREVLQKYLRHEISYPEWVQNDVRLLQGAGATKAKILDAIHVLKPMAGAVDTIRTLKVHGFKVFVISGGIDLVIEAVFGDTAKDLFDEVFINRYLFDEDGKLADAIPTPYDMEHKATCIDVTAKKFGLTPNDCYFIGDNENDVEAATLAGTSIAFNNKSDMLAQVATHTVDSMNLADILPFMIP